MLEIIFTAMFGIIYSIKGIFVLFVVPYLIMKRFNDFKYTFLVNKIIILFTGVIWSSVVYACLFMGEGYSTEIAKLENLCAVLGILLAIDIERIDDWMEKKDVKGFLKYALDTIFGGKI